MDLVLSIISFIYNSKFGITVPIIIVLGILALYFLFIGDKRKVSYYVSHKRNSKKFFIVFGIFAISILVIDLGCINSKVIMFVLVGLNGLLLISSIYTLKKPFWLIDRQLQKHSKNIDSGFLLDSKSFFESKRWYIKGYAAKINFIKLKMKYYLAINENFKMLKCSEEIEDKYLYKEERYYILSQKVKALVRMGDICAADNVLNVLKKSTESEELNPYTPFIYSVQSYFFEQRGDIEKAFGAVDSAKGFLSSIKVTKEMKAQVYNDYARIQVMKGNQLDAYRHYKLAYEEAILVEPINVQLLHAIITNIIFNGCQIDSQECKSFLVQYKTYLDMGSVSNIMNYINTEILLYQQLGDKEKVFESIKKRYDKTFNKIEFNELAELQADTFKLLLESGSDYSWILVDIEKAINQYFGLPAKQKLRIFQVFINSLKPSDFKFTREQPPFSLLIPKIANYYKNQALDDVNKIIESLNHHENYEYLFYNKIKLDIMEVLDPKNFITNQEKIFLDLYKTFYDAGLHITAIEILLDLIVSFANPKFIYIEKDQSNFPISYQEVLDILPSFPPEKVGFNPIHHNFEINNQYKITAKYSDKISIHLSTIMSEFAKWQKHPFKLKVSIYIAYFLMALEREEEAEVYYNFFVESNVSIVNYSIWAQNIFHELQLYFNNKPT